MSRGFTIAAARLHVWRPRHRTRFGYDLHRGPLGWRLTISVRWLMVRILGPVPR